jgi:hypothetical protein
MPEASAGGTRVSLKKSVRRTDVVAKACEK